ncbi:DUF3040 domain-containing protein [Streptomyces phaeoluteigriseus]
MPQSDDERRPLLQRQPPHDDPHTVRPLGRRRTGAWWTLTAGLAALVIGVALPQGLLIATGLVLAGVGVQLFDVRSDAAGGRPGPPSG